MGIKHTKVSAVVDVASTALVRPSDWNDDHTIDGDVDFGGYDILNVGNAAVEGPPGPQGDPGPTGPQGSPGGNEQYYVNVMDFGATGDGSTDDTTAIQDAIDYAYANEYGTIYMPSGFYKTTTTIWLDPPLNARVNLAHPTMANFTLRLEGDGHGGSQFPGTYLYCNHSLTGLRVGPGQHMGVKGIGIIGENPGIGKFSQLNQVAGIQVLCTGGGAHVTTIEDCEVFYFKYAYEVGGNFDSLGDSTTLVRCQAFNCEIGYYVAGSQQFINACRDCVFTDCKIGFFSNFNLAIEVDGGNISCDFGGYGIHTMDTVSAIGAAGAADNDDENSFSGSTEYSTITVHLPGTGLGSVGDVWVAEQDRFAIKTDHYGIVPFYKVAYDTGTNVLTLQFVGDWIATLVDSGTNAFSVWGSLEAELQAATQLFGASLVTVFGSAGIYARDVHVENANTVVRLMRVQTGWQVSIDGKLENIYLNWDPSNPDDDDPALARHALNVLTVVWPFIQQDLGTNLFVDNLRGPGSSRCLYYINQELPHRAQFNNCLMNVNVKGPRRQNNPWDDLKCISSGGRGWGEWDRTPFHSGFRQSAHTNSNCWYHSMAGRTPFVGYHPAPWTLPRLTVAQLDLLSGTITLGTQATFTDYTTGPVSGDCLYRIGNFTSAAGEPSLVRFKHSGWTWGADITTAWEHKGGSPFIYMDDDGIKHMFCGLVIGLDYTGPTVLEYYTVIAIHSQHGYVEVMPSGFFTHPGNTPSTTTYTGSVIRQQAIAITRIGDIQAAALTDSHIAGKKFYVGDKIWQSAPAAAVSMGWICTTAGTAGTTAVFKAMATLT